jgi:hypothetical protein
MKLKKEVISINIDFLYDKFYENYLLKNGTDAEKIVLYLTPFVLKVNLRVIIYEFDNNSSVLSKDFECHLSDKQIITLLFRKTHYDLVYYDKYFETHAKELCYYVNIEENLRVVNHYELESKKHIKKNMDKLVNKKMEEDTEQECFPKCLNCDQEYIHKQNLFSICVNCLKSEIYNQVMAFYLTYLTEVLSSLDELTDGQIIRLYHSCIIH